jgi:uncharacterized protein (TIGR03435 family)
MRTTKESSVLVLHVAKGGSKLQPVSQDGSDEGFSMGVRRIYTDPVGSMSGFVSVLGNLMGQVVIDKTELKELYKLI